MSIGVFSDFQTNFNASSGYEKTKGNEKENKSYPKSEDKSKVIDKVKAAAPIVIPLVTIPITAGITYKLAAKNVSGLQNDISDLRKQIANIQVLDEARSGKLIDNMKKLSKSNKKANAQIWSAIIAAAGLSGSYAAGKLSKDDKNNISERLSQRVNNIETNSQKAINDSQQSLALSGNSLGTKYMHDYNGIQLLTNSDSLNKNEQKYAKAIKRIKSAAPKYLYEAPDVKAIKKENPTIWSITSEFAPIKEGGLGSVPVEIQNNVTKLGVNIPTFIPMYQQKGIASFKEENGEYTYTYKNNEFKLEKAASFKLDTYQGGKSKTEDVEIFVNNSKDNDGNNKQLIFIKNDNYFNGTIYQSSEKTEEPEKFAFFSKAVYEFAKAKEDIKSVKDLVIADKSAFDSIEAPDGLILNDWQASPIAALARYKAPMENVYGQLSDEAAEKLSDMTIITIGHNAMYQGSTRNNNNDTQRKEATTNILNTLFDNFAADIVLNAKTNAKETDPEDSGLKNLDNVLILNGEDCYSNHTNLLNMGICLSDYFHPVSENYAKEIISDEHPELAGELRWALSKKSDAGSLVGIINGNDFKNLSIEAKKQQIKSQTDIDFKTYSKDSDISDVMQARKENKINFYNNYILPFSHKNDATNTTEDVERIRKLTSKLEFVDRKGKTNLPELTDDELSKTPIITSCGRLVSQKGIGIMTDAIKMLMDNWEKDFPENPKPIFYIAGSDGEGGAQRKYIEDLKDNKLKKEDSDRVVFAHGYAPMSAMTAASDFFLLPSIFEPCGLTQGEAFAVATPVIGSAVGGIVDTVNRDEKTNGILTDKSKPLTAKGLYEAMKEGLNIYYNNPEQYQNMVKDALAEDFSWIQKGKQGPVFDYLEKIGIDREMLPDANQG
ncbi:MAG: glycogen/starch synthase [Candidatus Gastranaerophilales bacterium]|nr:glycogen/starch synthase [Candidatus Gastranaerophilales bacterium]